MQALDGTDLETINSNDIRDALAGVTFDGVTGAISFDENGDAVKDTAYIKTITEESLQTSSFQFVKTQTVADL